MKRIKLFLMLLTMMSTTVVWADDPEKEIYIDDNYGVAYEYVPESDTAWVAAGIRKHLQESDWAIGSQTAVYKNTIASTVVIPQTLTISGKEYTVTGIDREAFYNEKGITSITIPKTVKYISVFSLAECSSLTDIYCYANPNKLYWNPTGYFFSIYDNLPKGVRIHVIGGYLERYESKFSNFSDFNATFVGDLDGEVEPEEEEEVITGTTGDLTWKLEPIGTVDYPTGKKPAYRLTIEGTGNMPRYESLGNNKDERRTIYNRPWDAQIKDIMEIVIGEGVLNIGLYAFSDAGVYKVSLPEGLEMIDQAAFSYCYALRSVHLPSTLTSIYSGSFMDNHLESLTIAEGNPKYESRDANAVILKESDEIFLATPATVIPASVKSIGERAYQDLRSMERLVIPDNVTSIGIDAFLNCYGLKELSIGKGVNHIGKNAFWYCDYLADVYCYANPSALTWDEYDFARNFIRNKGTKFHVPANYLATWESKFPDMNVTYVGDLENQDPVGDKGDASGDGKTDADDVVALMNYLAGKKPDGFDESAADVNGDGKIDIADIIALVNKLF